MPGSISPLNGGEQLAILLRQFDARLTALETAQRLQFQYAAVPTYDTTSSGTGSSPVQLASTVGPNINNLALGYSGKFILLGLSYINPSQLVAAPAGGETAAMSVQVTTVGGVSVLPWFTIVSYGIPAGTQMSGMFTGALLIGGQSLAFQTVNIAAAYWVSTSGVQAQFGLRTLIAMPL